MKRPPHEALEQLSKEELIEFLYAMFDAFETEIAQLRTEIEKLKPPSPPPTTSQNSSQPPSRDVKGNRLAPAQRPAKKRGA